MRCVTVEIAVTDIRIPSATNHILINEITVIVKGVCYASARELGLIGPCYPHQAKSKCIGPTSNLTILWYGCSVQDRLKP